MIVRGTKKRRAAPRKSFLNPAQKKALKNQLIDRYTKSFGLSQPQVVSECVNTFFKSRKQINQETLATLERKTRQAVISANQGNSRNPGQNKQKPRDVKRVSGSGAVSEHDRAIFENEEEAGLESNPNSRENELKRQVYQMIENQTREDVVNGTQGLDALDGILEAELGLQSKKNPTLRLKRYLDRQEKELQHVSRKLAHKIVQKELDQQVKEKQNIKKAKLAEETEYVQATNKMMNQHRRLKSAERKKKLEDKAKLRDMQLRIVAQRQAKIDREKRESDEQDRLLVRSIQKDLREQEKIQIQRVKKKRNEMREVMRENEKRRMEKDSLEAQIRKEENDLQLKANKISEEMELQRMREIEAKKTKMHLLFVQ